MILTIFSLWKNLVGGTKRENCRYLGIHYEAFFQTLFKGDCRNEIELDTVYSYKDAHQ